MGQPGCKSKMGEMIIVATSKGRDSKYLLSGYNINNVSDLLLGAANDIISYNPQRALKIFANTLINTDE